ncbi:MAG: hypothetical protein ISQ32_00955 [Rickettsiales bacterium]|nr:hypothetical protein [Rickettsiales bacterium]
MFKAKIIYIILILFAINFTGCTNKSQKHGVRLETKLINQVKEDFANDNLTIESLTQTLGPYSTIYQVGNNIHIIYMQINRAIPPIQKDFIKSSEIYEFISNDQQIIAINFYDQLNEIALNKNQTIHEDKNFSIFKQIFSNVGKIAGTSHGE